MSHVPLDLARTPIAKAPASDASSAARPVVRVLEPEAAVRRDLRQILDEAGHEVAEFSSVGDLRRPCCVR